MKVGGLCNEGPGAERAGLRCLPEKDNQSRQLSGVPRGGTEALTPGRAGSPGLPPSLDHQSTGPGRPPPSVVPERAAAAPNTGRVVDSSHADPTLLQGPRGPIPPSRPLPGSSRPALCSQTHL